MILRSREDFVEFLKAERRGRGLSQSRFAAVIGRDQQVVSQYEAGRRCTLPSFLAIAARLGYRVSLTREPAAGGPS